jgi:hypothetical protein
MSIVWVVFKHDRTTAHSLRHPRALLFAKGYKLQCATDY